MTDDDVRAFEIEVLGHERARRAMVLGAAAEVAPTVPARPSFFARMEAVPAHGWVAIGLGALALGVGLTALIRK